MGQGSKAILWGTFYIVLVLLAFVVVYSMLDYLNFLPPWVEAD